MRTSSDKAVSTILSVVAIVVSVIALLFSGLQWWDTHRQVQVSQNQLLLAMKPSIDFDIENDADDLPAGVKIQSTGLAPAVIQSITYFIDKKPVGDAAGMLDSAGLGNAPNIDSLSFDKGDNLAVGENRWIVWSKTKPRGKDEKQNLARFVELVDKHLAVEVKYCPVIVGDCYTKCSTIGMCR